MAVNVKRILSIILLISILLATTCIPSYAGKEKTPEINAESAIVYCENTGEIVFSKNENDKYNPLSITKLMTVLLAIQNLPMEQQVTVSAEAVKQSGSSMGLQEGEVITVKDLIYGALLCSGNDAAYAIGEAVSGDIDSFIALMNTTAVNIGCKNTHFSNPNGLENKEHLSTAYDLLQISKIALSNDKIREISETDEYVLKETNKNKERTINNSLTSFKSQIKGLKAGKTGYADDENCSIAFKYESAGLDLWVILLKDSKEGRVSDSNILTEYASKKISGLKVIDADKDAGKVRIKHGAKTSIKAYTEEAGYAYLPKQASDTLISTNVVIKKDVEAPVKKGTVVGKYQIFVADEIVNEINLVAKEDVPTGWFTSYLGISNNAAIVIGILLILAVALFIWISVLKMKYIRKKKMLRKQKILAMAEEQLKREQEYNDRGWKF